MVDRDERNCPDPVPTQPDCEESAPPPGDVTRILSAIEQGDGLAAEQLLPLVYGELRKLAAAKMAHEKPGQTLQATALVHEAYLRLVKSPESLPWSGRGHFFGAAAEAMRRILIENARRKERLRQAGQAVRVELSDVELVTNLPPDQLLELNDAIEALATHDQLAADVVNICYFAGLSVEHAAQSLGIARSTAYEHWTYARAWLSATLRRGDAKKKS